MVSLTQKSSSLMKETQICQPVSGTTYFLPCSTYGFLSSTSKIYLFLVCVIWGLACMCVCVLQGHSEQRTQKFRRGLRKNAAYRLAPPGSLSLFLLTSRTTNPGAVPTQGQHYPYLSDTSISRKCITGLPTGQPGEGIISI